MSKKLIALLSATTLLLGYAVFMTWFNPEPSNPDTLLAYKGTIVYRCVHDGYPIRWCEDTRNQYFRAPKENYHWVILGNWDVTRPPHGTYAIYNSRWFDRGWGSSDHRLPMMIVEMEAYTDGTLITENIEESLKAEESR
jgi:hypothetical protein